MSSSDFRGKPEGPEHQPPPSTLLLSKDTCPRDTLKLQACANVLTLAKIYVGEKEKPLAAVSLMVLLILKLLFAFALESEWISWALLSWTFLFLWRYVLLNECNRKVAEKFECPSS